jgi:hypothetical protein
MAIRELKVIPEHKVLKERQGRKVRREILELKEQPEHRDLREQPELRVLKVIPEHKVLKERQGRKVRKALRAVIAIPSWQLWILINPPAQILTQLLYRDLYLLTRQTLSIAFGLWVE